MRISGFYQWVMISCITRKISDSSRQQLIIDKAEELEERTGKLRKILSELDKLAIQTDVPIYIGDREADYYIQLTDVIQILINNL